MKAGEIITRKGIILDKKKFMVRSNGTEGTDV